MAKKPYPNIQWRGGVAQLEVVVDGKRIRESLGTHDSREAVKRRDQRIAELRGKVLTDAPPSSWHSPGAAPKSFPSLDEMFERHAAKCRRERNSSENTINSDIRCRWKRLKEFYSHMGEATPESIPQYIDFQLRKGRVQQTIKKDLWSIRLGNEWARETHPELAPITKLPRLAEAEPGNQAGRAIEDEELQAWLAELTPESRAIALLVLFTGLRAWTVRALDESFIRLTPKDAVLAAKLELPAKVMKTKRKHQVGLTQFGLRVLHKALPVIHQNPKKGFNAAARRAKIQGVSLRDLRHTFATRVGQHDPFGVELVLAHRAGGSRVSAAYHHANDERLGRIAKLAEDAFAGPWIREHLKVVS